MKVSEIIRNRRIELGMTQQDVADAYVLRAGGWSTPHVMQKVYRHALDNVHLEYEQKAVSAFQNTFQY
jgi:transcriptional regulator with XRE-family HTH domain